MFLLLLIKEHYVGNNIKFDHDYLLLKMFRNWLKPLTIQFHPYILTILFTYFKEKLLYYNEIENTKKIIYKKDFIDPMRRSKLSLKCC